MKEVFSDDAPRYRKKASKKTPVKADHRHEFVNCVYELPTVRYDEARGFVPDSKLSIGTYCRICGKIGVHFDQDGEWKEKEPISRHWGFFGYKWSAKAEAEFDEKTRTLPFFRIDDSFKQKFVKTEE